MYIPKHFDEPRLDVLHGLIRSYPLATVVTHTATGLDANSIPLLLATGPATEPASFGTLSGHVARANPLWRELACGTDVLAIFQGPNAYITPSWYPSKAETGRVVPTWNYAVAHAHGTMRAIDDEDWLRQHLAQATAQHEAGFDQPWQLNDAPEDYVAGMLKAVVGIEISITRLSGKYKLSQNQPAQNRAGVISGLRETGKARALELAELMTYPSTQKEED